MRKGLSTSVFAVILTAFSSLIILGVVFGFAGQATAFVKKETVDVQSTQITAAALALDSMPQGDTQVEMEGYSYRYSEGAIEVKYGESTGKSDASYLAKAYDTIKAPREFEKTTGSLLISKTWEDGEEVLEISSVEE